MRILGMKLSKLFREFLCGLRQWCGDSAYETYVAAQSRGTGPQPMPPAEFYVDQLNRKYSRPNRCC